jgi:hypothetical protein
MKRTLLLAMVAAFGVTAFARDPEGKIANADKILNEIWNELTPALCQELRASEIAFIHQGDATTDLDKKLSLTEQRVDYLLSLQPMPRISTQAEVARLPYGTKFVWVPERTSLCAARGSKVTDCRKQNLRLA